MMFYGTTVADNIAFKYFIQHHITLNEALFYYISLYNF
jgi:hypothetical protein